MWWSLGDDGHIFGSWPNGCPDAVWEHQRCTCQIFLLGEALWIKLKVGWECQRRWSTGTYHRECNLRCFLLFLIDTSIFVDKSATSMWHNLRISSICWSFTSGTRGLLFGIPVLQAEQRFSLDDKANDRLLHLVGGNFHTHINIKTTFFTLVTNTFFLFIFRDGSYPTFTAYTSLIVC